MQALANELCGSDSRVMVVTAQPPAAILPTLRDSVKAELAALGTPAESIKRRLRACLERVSVSRVFDLDGLWEVLGDLDISPGSPCSESPLMPEGDIKSPASPVQDDVWSKPEPESFVLPDLKPRPEYHPRPARTEVADSDEDEAFSPPTASSESSELSPPPSTLASMLVAPDPYENPDVSDISSDVRRSPDKIHILDAEEEELPMAAEELVGDQQTWTTQSPKKEDDKPPLPNIILITHFSTLMTALFTRLDRASAHDALQCLSDCLRYLSRSLSTSPLIMLLNSTSSSKYNHPAQPESSVLQNVPNAANGPKEGQPPPAVDESPAKSSVRPIDQSLCSVFNPRPLDVHGYNNRMLSRRNKPTFGLVFSQFLDLHLLCTKVPRTKEDGERLFATSDVDVGKDVKFTWVTEVLLDEMGVWNEESPRGGRKCREQRWAPVDVTPGRIVDAFAGLAEKKKDVGDVRVVGGFGGPRV